MNEATLYFYTYDDLRRAARVSPRLSDAWLLRLAAGGRGRLAHCNVKDTRRNLIYECSARYGFNLAPVPYPARPSAIVRIMVKDWGMTPEQWVLQRFTPIRATLDCLGFPRFWPVESCVTSTCRLIGIDPGYCRRPQDLLQVLVQSGGSSNVFPL